MLRCCERRVPDASSDPRAYMERHPGALFTLQFRALRVANRNDLWRAVDCNYTVPSVEISFNTVFGRTGGASVQTDYSTLWNSAADDGWKEILDAAWAYRQKSSIPESRRALISRFTFVKFPPDIRFSDYTARKTAPPISQAMQCSLELCARTFTTPSYANFSASPLAGPQTPLTTTSEGTTDAEDALAWVELKPASSDELPESTVFRVNYCDYDDISRYLKDLFTTTMSTTGVVGTTEDTPTSGATQIRQRSTPGLGLTDDVEKRAQLMEAQLLSEEKLRFSKAE
ncbi:hypothetical protein CSOJ01_08681 [Colletotrichum sojae]|uniref:Uncharacterized protein n=1 Tax=Colletotrichum sojae TaxID=2175907 RepID=A0A8H6J573_9PEZI|nr:hypothetical protein CSOJ01_08681 [Colletotrichum sojae]